MFEQLSPRGTQLPLPPQPVCAKHFYCHCHFHSTPIPACLDDLMAASQEDPKDQFFSALYQLDHLSDEDHVQEPTTAPGQRPSAAGLTSETVPVQKSLVPNISRQALPLERPWTSPIAADAESPKKAIRRERRPATPRIPPPLASSKAHKCKRNSWSICIPEAQQIFRGSMFYFIPNNDVAGPRKLRIQRALDYGAAWERAWSARVTHVIVDSNLTMPDVLKHFRGEKLPVGAIPFIAGHR